MEKWDEVRTAYEVARLGTISAAAEALGLHRATVVRHVDALEGELGAKLFHRNARGYVPTEAGDDLLRVARAAEEGFADFVGRTRGRLQEVSGELIVTSVEMMGPPIIAAVRRFRATYPRTTVRYRVSEALLKLEYGEAHIAVRAGPEPTHLDNVVQPLAIIRPAMYAHRTYVDGFGCPESEDALAGHLFVGPENANPRLTFVTWLMERVPEACFVFRTSSPQFQIDAVRAGIGIGFMPEHIARHDADLVQVIAPRPEWEASVWLLTHVDLHRTAKVQAFLALAKEEAAHM